MFYTEVVADKSVYRGFLLWTILLSLKGSLMINWSQTILLLGSPVIGNLWGIPAVNSSTFPPQILQWNVYGSHCLVFLFWLIDEVPKWGSQISMYNSVTRWLCFLSQKSPLEAVKPKKHFTYTNNVGLVLYWEQIRGKAAWFPTLTCIITNLHFFNNFSVTEICYIHDYDNSGDNVVHR